MLTFGGIARSEAPPASLLAACDITANTMSFSIYDPSAPYDDSAVGTILITCNGPHPLQVSLITNDPCTQRYLRSAANRLAYNLYQDPGHQIVWGSANPICGRTAVTDKTRLAQFSIYGNIPRLQNVRAGAYSDAVTIQVDF